MDASSTSSSSEQTSERSGSPATEVFTVTSTSPAVTPTKRPSNRYWRNRSTWYSVKGRENVYVNIRTNAKHDPSLTRRWAVRVLPAATLTQEDLRDENLTSIPWIDVQSNLAKLARETKAKRLAQTDTESVTEFSPDEIVEFTQTAVPTTMMGERERLFRSLAPDARRELYNSTLQRTKGKATSTRGTTSGDTVKAPSQAPQTNGGAESENRFDMRSLCVALPLYPVGSRTSGERGSKRVGEKPESSDEGSS